MRLELNGTYSRITNIVADQEVSVAVYQGSPNRQDGYRALPVTVYDKEYITAHYSTSDTAIGFAIVAIEDNTDISILPPTSISYQDLTANSTTPMNITLNRHKVFHYATIANLTGTLITANKPVAVFGYNEATKIPLNYNGSDYLIAQYLATKYFGSSYILTRFPLRANSTFRIIAAQDNTVIRSDSAILATINKTKFFELTLNTAIQDLFCTPSCLVVAFSHGYSTDNTTSDPSMTIVPSSFQYMRDYSLYFINQTEFGVDTAYIIVMMESTYKLNLRIDNAVVSTNTGWSTVMMSGVSYDATSIPVTKSHHIVNFFGAGMLGLLQYGQSGRYGAYSLPGGFLFPTFFRCKYATHVFKASHTITCNSQIIIVNLSYISSVKFK